MSRRTHPLHHAVEKLTRDTFKKHGFAEARVLTDWSHIIGTKLASACVPLKITYPKGKTQDGTLLLQVASHRALEIQHMEPMILERINTYFGYAAINRIRLQQAMMKPEKKTPKPAQKTPGSNMQILLQSVEDEELRATLTRLAGYVETD